MDITDLDKTRMPQHVAVIMDGNGRWAQQRNEQRLYGHQHALTAVRETLKTIQECGIPYVTLYAFSTENWNRHKDEVDGLMQLITQAITDEFQHMLDENVRLTIIGDMSRLPHDTCTQLQRCVEKSKDNTGSTVIIALSYSSRWEITEAVRQMVDAAAKGDLKPQEVNESLISHYLTTNGIPDPDLLIRTSGELRISNFLLWQLAYSELYFTDVLWPDFRREHMLQAIADYQKRQRRFGKSSDQIADEKKR